MSRNPKNPNHKILIICDYLLDDCLDVCILQDVTSSDPGWWKCYGTCVYSVHFEFSKASQFYFLLYIFFFPGWIEVGLKL